MLQLVTFRSLSFNEILDYRSRSRPRMTILPAPLPEGSFLRDVLEDAPIATRTRAAGAEGRIDSWQQAARTLTTPVGQDQLESVAAKVLVALSMTEGKRGVFSRYAREW